MGNIEYKYKVLDLFAGAGGLSLGFTQTGRFAITVAVENNKNAQSTFLQSASSLLRLDMKASFDISVSLTTCLSLFRSTNNCWRGKPRSI